MELFNEILTAVHEDFFGCIVGAQSTITNNNSTSIDYITDWSIPMSNG